MPETKAAVLFDNRARDEQTGKEYELIPEKKLDMFIALLSTIYLLFSLVFSLWLLFDVWTRNYSFVFGNSNLKNALFNQAFQTPAYAFIGGLLGGTVNGIRSIISWHSERKSFGSRFIYKYLSLPLLGGTLALFAYALLSSGIAVLSGVSPSGTENANASLSMFSLGALAGYGSHKLFVWLDSHVNRIFKTTDSTSGTQLVFNKKSQESENYNTETECDTISEDSNRETVTEDSEEDKERISNSKFNLMSK